MPGMENVGGGQAGMKETRLILNGICDSKKINYYLRLSIYQEIS